MGVKDGGWWMMDVGCESHTPVTEFWTFKLSWLELDQIKFQSLHQKKILLAAIGGGADVSRMQRETKQLRRETNLTLNDIK